MEKVCFFVHKWRSDTSQQRKSQEFFTVIYLVLRKWCGFFVHKWRSLNSQKKFLWIFCSQMTLTQFPICGFFVHNFQIGVKRHCKYIVPTNICLYGLNNKYISMTSVHPIAGLLRNQNMTWTSKIRTLSIGTQNTKAGNFDLW